MNPNRQPLSPARRAARALVWITLGMVVFVRLFWFHPEPRRQVDNRRPWFQQDQRFGRPRAWSAPVEPPANPVPRDLPRLDIQIAPGDVNTLRSYSWNGWRGGQQHQDRPEVLVTVHEGDVIYTNVSLHLKGAAGSFRPFDDKPALTLNFGKHAPGQKFHQYTKLSLNNSVQDPTFICEALCRELYVQGGVPAPRADWATVVINGRDLGLYVLVEGWGKEFLHRFFKDVKGNLYDGGFVQDITAPLDVNSGEHPEDHSDLQRLASAAHEPAPDRRWKRLTQVLDTDRFITLLAMEVILCHWDGYALNRNNYRVFHDLDTDRMVFMPHGLDQMFGFPQNRFQPEDSIQPNMKGLVAAAVISTPEGSQLYFERLAALRTNVFKPEVVLARVQEMAQRVRPTLAAYSPSMAQWHDNAVASLLDRIQRRLRSVTEQLENPRQPIHFDADGTAPLNQWTLPFRSNGASLRIDTVTEDGKTLLHVATDNQGGTGSWRSRVFLGGGRYRFEGRARISSEAIGSRVALRISGDRTIFPPVTTTDWFPLTYEFPVHGPGAEFVLVCEFSGTRGEAWFDLDSLRLVREGRGFQAPQ